MRAWYAGASTIQTNIAPQDTGRFLPQVKPGWAYNASLGVAAPILLDGAKRDRAVWPGDMGLSGITAFLVFGEYGLTAFGNAIETLFYYQNTTTGRFPFAGPDTASFRSGSTSDTYHAWSLISIYEYAIYTGNETWLSERWENITRGVDFVLAALDNTVSLHNQTAPNDWGRQGGGEYNSALNALDYHALVSLSSLASAWSDTISGRTRAQTWALAAARLKSSYNSHLWDAPANLYHDNTTTSLHPQDGNALALAFNLTTSTAQASVLSTALIQNWNAIGPVTPELPDTISPFISGIEVLGHFAAGQPVRALDLVRRTWGYLLDSPLMTGSTLAEGITANGSLYYRSTAGYNYDASYTSLSHGWSSGPTIALSFKVAGLEIIGWREWVFKPQTGGLRSAKAGFRAPFGEFRVQWVVRGKEDGDMIFEATIVTPEGTRGRLGMPGECENVLVDGKAVAATVEGGGIRVVKATGCR
ncbi:glycoside hydrolase family 78 protein [Lophiostoma macrostomum CBS 122681]|uniref:Glycoside hydrolase family 78 protein n=1 Tax=Lophiostoma macrostomum CBS 122681 TaxID=1314788 RepID=A0A6A6TR89_9PLEO|nr:glycoside hydrolase family 78 protein [Lophiostoma macrostomum CBS 122681]